MALYKYQHRTEIIMDKKNPDVDYLEQAIQQASKTDAVASALIDIAISLRIIANRSAQPAKLGLWEEPNASTRIGVGQFPNEPATYENKNYDTGYQLPKRDVL